jgi:hypothetical protein
MGLLESLKIVALAVAAAIVYGILHDQVTARLCIEYFTVAHPPVFHTESPTLLAIGWGIIATWWAGVFVGVPAAIAAQLGSWPRLSARRLLGPIVKLLVGMGCLAFLAGLGGFVLARVVPLPEPWAHQIPAAKHALFLADAMAHQASYAGGFLGGWTLSLWIVLHRRTLARAARKQNVGQVA